MEISFKYQKKDYLSEYQEEYSIDYVCKNFAEIMTLDSNKLYFYYQFKIIIFGKDKSIGQMLSSFNSNSYEQFDGQKRMEISVFDEIFFSLNLLIMDWLISYR